MPKNPTTSSTAEPLRPSTTTAELAEKIRAALATNAERLALLNERAIGMQIANPNDLNGRAAFLTRCTNCAGQGFKTHWHRDGSAPTSRSKCDVCDGQAVVIGLHYGVPLLELLAHVLAPTARPEATEAAIEEFNRAEQAKHDERKRQEAEERKARADQVKKMLEDAGEDAGALERVASFLRGTSDGAGR